MYHKTIILIFIFLSFSCFADVCDSHQNCEHKFFNNTRFLKYYSSFPLEKENLSIERLVIVIHGALRNGNDYFDHTVKAAKKFQITDKVLIVAPTFKRSSDSREIDELYWGGHWTTKWKYGYPSQDEEGVSSFVVIDNLIKTISNSKKFPRLKEVVITGHSAGGQFTQRYAVFSKVRNEIVQKITFIPSNPSSYMYLDPERYHFSKGNFLLKEIPINECPEYDHYIYGLQNRPVIFNATANLKNNFASNNVTYLMSEEDKGTDSLDRSCEANLQGMNRFERSINYWYYSKKHIQSTKHQYVSIANIAHEHEDVYNSDEAKEIVFGIKPLSFENILYKKIGNTQNYEQSPIKRNDFFLLLGGGKNEEQGISRFLKATHGGDVLVISAKDELNHRYTHDLWQIATQNTISINSVETISLLNRKASDNKLVISKIKKAEAIFFTGGNQAKYIERIKGTKAHTEIIKKVQQNIPIAGTSAGLAIMGEFIFTAQRGGLSSHYVFNNPHSKDITIDRDFFYSPMLKNTIIDTHFSERNRKNRLLGFMFRVQFDYNQKFVYGLGIDEQSSLSMYQFDSNYYMIAEGGVWLYQSLEKNVIRQTGSLNYSFKEFKLPTKTVTDHFLL